MFRELKSDRVIMRTLNHGDWKTIKFLRSDDVVNKYVERPGANDKEEAIAFIDKISKGIDSNQICYWAMALKADSDNMIGSICLWNFEFDENIAELGYDLKPEYQSKGYMSEALSRVIDFGFVDLKLKSLEAYTHFGNEASLKLLNKYGFHLLEAKKDSTNSNNVVYRLINSQ